jgi:hypothetical protein
MDTAAREGWERRRFDLAVPARRCLWRRTGHGMEMGHDLWLPSGKHNGPERFAPCRLIRDLGMDGRAKPGPARQQQDALKSNARADPVFLTVTFTAENYKELGSHDRGPRVQLIARDVALHCRTELVETGA